MADEQYWAVIPAAGSGERMGSDLPKQYYPLCGKPLIEHTLDRFCTHPRIKGVVVAIAEHDRYWRELKLSYANEVLFVTGGAKRCHSVLNGLKRAEQIGRAQDWVLVHDAARPCVRKEDIDRLLSVLADDPVGGLLALPVRDTMKRSQSDNTVCETVEREGLWHALTPQMFRLEPLRRAIEAALAEGRLVTDEAQAMEFAGAAPRLVEGHPDNIKITSRADLALAELYLRQQAQEGCG
ncbi:MAG: 2-C-methyl-D-erythritol 4-phosphate cytidylyltransferase [Gammaproteobacteria bacterium]|nr:2-C-methyl-D-erythritol 4-phosphate cytidylyltransferase [Gammaproteobacteria bacterium]